MPYEFTERGVALQEEVRSFLDDHIYPNELEYHEQSAEVGQTGYPPILDKLKAAARERNLWNLFLPHLAPDAPGTKLTNLDYAPISEQLGKVGFASEALSKEFTFYVPKPAHRQEAAKSKIKADSAAVSEN